MLLKNLSTLFISLLALLPVASSALEGDRDQPIEIQADAAMLDETQGKSIYQGSVIITQGSLQVSAEEVEILTVDSEVTQIIAIAADGELANYQQQMNDQKDMVTAEARKITYLVQEERLHLAGNARLQQVEDVFAGELLYYDMAKGVVNLDSTGGTGRVNMTISPKKSPQ